MNRPASLYPFLALVFALVLAPARAADNPARPASAMPATVPPAGPALALDEAVARALAQNFDLAIQRLSNASSRDSVVVADADFDPTLNASTSKSRSESALLGNTTPNSLRDSENARVGITKRIDSGATLGLTETLNRSKSSFGAPNPSYGGDLTITIRQPLLQGAGTAVNRASRDRARLGVQRANADLKGTVLTVVRNVESAYYNLVFAREQLGVRQFAFDIAQKFLDETQLRRAAGDRTPLDVTQATLSVEQARLNVVNAIDAVRSREDALLALIGRFEFDQLIGPVALGDEPVPTLSLASSYARARASQPDQLSARLALEQARLDLLTAENNLKPTLDVDASLGLASTEGSYGRAFTEPITAHGYDWSLGFSLSVPWGQRADKARFRQAQTSLSSEEARLQQLDQNLLASVRAAVRAVETSRESLKIATLALQLSKEQYDAEDARFRAGLSTVRLVNDARNDLNNAQISELQSRVNLRQSLSDLSRLETTTLERYRIKLAE